MSLKQIDAYYENLRKAKQKSVAVGLVKGKATSRIYGDGTTVVEVGSWHEYGAGKNPQRSFLRTPFIVKKGDIGHALRSQFKLVAEQGKDAIKALKTVGLEAENISKEAFVTGGYGQWKALSPFTIAKKGSSQILIDKGILRSSITSEVR